jgi:sulfatase modifying factor 1
MKPIRVFLLLLLIIPTFFSCHKKTTEPDNNPIVATPEFSPTGGTYTSSQSVTISCETSDATILYTVNGDEPTSTSTLYSNPISITVTATLKAKAFKTGWDDSETASAAYVINLPDTVANPVFSPPEGTYTTAQNIAISCATSGASIRYTTDGTEPTSASTLYSISIAISATTTIKAKAFKSGMIDSDIVTANYIINLLPEDMIYVPSGTFTMGRTIGSGSGDEIPTHQVTLSPFYIGKYEVTQAEWSAVMGGNPSHFTGDLNRPVEEISWYDVLVYCNKRSISEGITPVYSLGSSTNPDEWGLIPVNSSDTWNSMTCNWLANGYRMPTEAEWEYAARGATNNPDYLYAGSDDVNLVAWYDANSNNTTHPVGLKQANGLGIYDMSGNVWEYCWDWFGSYDSASESNPTGTNDGVCKILRGGAWDPNDDDGRRIVSRGWWEPQASNNNGGVRLVRTY